MALFTARRLGVVLFVFWVLMMGALAKREGLLDGLLGVERPEARRTLRPGDSWMGVFLPDNSRVGFLNTNALPDTRGGKLGLTTTITARLRLTLLTTPMNIFISGTTWIPADGSLSEFDFNVRSGDHIMTAKATVEGGVLKGAIKTAGETIPLEIPVGRDLMLSGAFGASSTGIPSLRVGEEVSVDTFDPMTFSSGKARVACVGEETLQIAGEPVRAKVLKTDLNGLESKAWVAENDEIVQASTPLGFMLRKVTPEEAMKPADRSDGQNLLRAVAVQPTGLRPFRGAKKMVAEVSGVGGERRPPDSPTQSGVGDEYTLLSAVAPQENERSLDANDEDALRTSALIQADHPKIQERAKAIVGGETDPWKRAQVLYEWVYGNIKKVSVFSIPSALEVLETGEGDCNEHTALYAALARSLGIPTRMAIGVVWSDELSGFYYHAWPEVFVSGWRAIDPTLGQPLADATHFVLVYGDIDRWTQLIPYLGQLKIDVKTVE